MMTLIIETCVLVFSFICVILLYTIFDRKGGLHWYPKHIQEIAIERNLITKEKLDKQKNQSKWLMLVICLVIVVVSVFVMNRVDTWLSAFLQISFMALIMNWVDAIFVDYVWVRKTKYWVIDELSDYPDIGKPTKQIIKERLISSVVLIVISAILACLVFIL